MGNVIWFMFFRISVLREITPDFHAGRIGFITIIIASVATAVGNGLFMASDSYKFSYAATFVIGAATGFVQSFVHGALFTVLISRIGQRMMPESDFFRVRVSSIVGIAYAPNVLRVLVFLPGVFGAIFLIVPAIWHAVLVFIGTRFLVLEPSDKVTAPTPTNRYVPLVVITLLASWGFYVVIMYAGLAFAVAN